MSIKPLAQDSKSSILQWFNTYSLEVIFCYWTFLISCCKAFDANVGIMANFVYFLKTLIRWSRQIWQNHPSMVKVPGYQASDPRSIPGQVSEFCVNFILLNLCYLMRIMNKLKCVFFISIPNATKPSTNVWNVKMLSYTYDLVPDIGGQHLNILLLHKYCISIRTNCIRLC